MGNEDFPSWSQLYLKETDYGDMAPAVNVYAVDYAQTPQVTPFAVGDTSPLKVQTIQ